MREVTGRDNQIIKQALSIAIPIMLRYSLSSSNTMDMIRILKERGAGRHPADSSLTNFVNMIIEDLSAGKTFELEKNKKDGIQASHFEHAMKIYLEEIAPNWRS